MIDIDVWIWNSLDSNETIQFNLKFTAEEIFTIYQNLLQVTLSPTFQGSMDPPLLNSRKLV